jgi:hypothetical protein
MRTKNVTMTIADYCTLLERNEVAVDRTYQRSPEIWTNHSKSYLIETILRDFPIPKFAIHQITDLRSRRTVKYVVDGQQRTMAIREFYRDDLRLSKKLEHTAVSGRTYSELDDEDKNAFLSYVLQFDQFEAASEEVVREYFRRINSYTAPLNAEEQRHARFQGSMKWFVHALTEAYGDALINLGVISKKSSLRKADAKLFAELTHALINGITTTNSRALDNMYLRFDRVESLPGEARLRAAFDEAMEVVLGWPALHTTPLMRTNVFYSLVLAAIGARTAWPSLPKQAKLPRAVFATPEPPSQLLTLAAALEDPEAYPEYDEFIAASAEKTNVKAQRETRVAWLGRALGSSVR